MGYNQNPMSYPQNQTNYRPPMTGNPSCFICRGSGYKVNGKACKFCNFSAYLVPLGSYCSKCNNTGFRIKDRQKCHRCAYGNNGILPSSFSGYPMMNQNMGVCMKCNGTGFNSYKGKPCKCRKF
jgi:hypothetical protein